MTRFSIRRCFLLVVAVAVWTSLVPWTAAQEQDFVRMEDFSFTTDTIPYDLTKIFLPSTCSVKKQMVPNIRYTIRPFFDGHVIWTYPANILSLVYPEDQSNWDELRLEWNLTTNLEEITEAGVIIDFPPSQLQAVDICCSAQVQIQPGFPNLKYVTASTSSTLQADLSTVGVTTDAVVAKSSSSAATIFDISTSASAKIILNSDVPSSVTVSTSANLDLMGGSLSTLDVSTSATVKLQNCTVPNKFDVSTSANVEMTEVDGCANAGTSTGGRCSDGLDLELTIDTNQPLTLDGQTRCIQSTSGAFSINDSANGFWMILLFWAITFLSFLD